MWSRPTHVADNVPFTQDQVVFCRAPSLRKSSQQLLDCNHILSKVGQLIQLFPLNPQVFDGLICSQSACIYCYKPLQNFPIGQVS